MSSTRLPRREFLATGIGLAAAAMTTPRSVLGANDRINLGIIGCGGRGTYLLNQALEAEPGKIEIVALADVWSRQRETMAGLIAQKLPGQKPKQFARYHD